VYVKSGLAGFNFFWSDLQRFFKPPPSSNSTDKPPDFPMRTHGLWAHATVDEDLPVVTRSGIAAAGRLLE
jgi:hypothetical protein